MNLKMIIYHLLIALFFISEGDQGWSGDHLQMPRSLGLLHCPDLLEAASALPRDRQAAEAALRDLRQGGELHQRGHGGGRDLHRPEPATAAAPAWPERSDPSHYGPAPHRGLTQFLQTQQVLVGHGSPQVLQGQEL